MSQEHEGEVMTAHHDHPESKIYSEKDEILAYLAEHYNPSSQEVYRSPGSFGHEYLSGVMELDQLVQSLVEAHKKGTLCTCCMDERVNVPKSKDDSLIITSHKGCGAAGIMADMVKSDKNIRARFEKAVSILRDGQTTELIAQLETAEVSKDSVAISNAKDAFGLAWAAALAQHVNNADGRAKSDHIDVDAGHHYADMTVVDAAHVMQVDTVGEPGERAFFVSNPEGFIQGESVQAAYDSMVLYAKLSLNIARGSHSSLPPESQFVITVVRDDKFNQEAWDAAWVKDAVFLGEIQNGEYKLKNKDSVEQNVKVVFVDTAEIAEKKGSVAR